MPTAHRSQYTVSVSRPCACTPPMCLVSRWLDLAVCHRPWRQKALYRPRFRYPWANSILVTPALSQPPFLPLITSSCSLIYWRNPVEIKSAMHHGVLCWRKPTSIGHLLSTVHYRWYAVHYIGTIFDRSETTWTRYWPSDSSQMPACKYQKHPSKKFNF